MVVWYWLHYIEEKYILVVDPPVLPCSSTEDALFPDDGPGTLSLGIDPGFPLLPRQWKGVGPLEELPHTAG